MSKIRFMDRYGGYARQGFAPVTSNDVQSDIIHGCKEVFAHRFAPYGNKHGLTPSRQGTKKFLFKDTSVKFTDEFVAHKIATLQVLERAMGFKVLAKCEVVKNKNESYLFFEVSKHWGDSQPIAHILALFVRNHYPYNGIMEWPEMIEWLRRGRHATIKTTHAIIEIIANKGKIRANVEQGNGIADYAWKREEYLDWKQDGRAF